MSLSKRLQVAAAAFGLSASVFSVPAMSVELGETWVARHNVFLRAAPSLESAKVDVLGKGRDVTITEIHGPFVKVENPAVNVSGFVKLNHFDRTGSVTAESSQAAAKPVAKTPSGNSKFTPEEIQFIKALLTRPAASPGMAVNVPTGYGASGNQVFASIGGTTTDKTATNDDGLDGSASVGAGFGNPVKNVGVEIVANIVSLTDNAPGSDVGEEGTVSMKLSRSLNDTSSVSVGAENFAHWGDALNGTDPSLYVAYSKILRLSDDPMNPLTVGLSIGVGDERFQEVSNSVQKGSAGVFASASLAITRQVGVIADYNGNYFSAGVSVVPMRKHPLTLTFSAVNLDETSAANGGTASGDTELGLSAGYNWNF